MNPAKPQYTRCQSVTNGGNTCINPTVRYGNVDFGIPQNHGGNNYAAWCQQLGFSNFSGQVTFGTRSVTSPAGSLFGCSGFDDTVWHWCDWQDGFWFNQSLNFPSQGSTSITSITCTP